MRGHFHGVLGFDPPALGHEAVHLLDAALGVGRSGTCPTHLPRSWTGHRVRTPDDTDHEVPS